MAHKIDFRHACSTDSGRKKARGIHTHAAQPDRQGHQRREYLRQSDNYPARGGRTGALPRLHNSAGNPTESLDFYLDSSWPCPDRTVLCFLSGLFFYWDPLGKPLPDVSRVRQPALLWPIPDHNDTDHAWTIFSSHLARENIQIGRAHV